MPRRPVWRRRAWRPRGESTHAAPGRRGRPRGGAAPCRGTTRPARRRRRCARRSRARGRSTASPTSRNGLVNPADVHRSPRSSGWPQAQVGAGADGASAQPRARAVDDDRERERPARRTAAIPSRAGRGPARRSSGGAPGDEPATSRARQEQPRQRRRAGRRPTARKAVPAQPAARDLPRRGRALVRGGPSSTRPTSRTTPSTREPRRHGQRHQPDHDRRRPDAAVPPDATSVQEPLEGRPLRGEPVQRRHAGERQRADDERPARARHRPSAGRRGGRAPATPTAAPASRRRGTAGP